MSADSAGEKAKRFAGAAPVVCEQLVEELRCASCFLETQKNVILRVAGKQEESLHCWLCSFEAAKVKAVPARPLSFRTFSVPS